MFAGRRFLAAVTFTFGLVCCFAGSAFAQSGGVYLDELQIRNNGQVVFAENFEDGNISDWYSVCDASLFTVKQNPPSQLLWMNSHGKTKSSVGHNLTLNPRSISEVSAMVYIAPAKEQYAWQKAIASKFTIGFECSTPTSALNTVRIEVTLEPKDQSCKVGARRSFSPTIDKYIATEQSVLQTGKWAHLTLRLDPTNRLASAYLGKTQVASIPCAPADFPKISSVILTSTFGDGSLQIADKNSEDSQSIAETQMQTIWNADTGLAKFKAIDAVVKKGKESDIAVRQAILSLAATAMNDKNRGLLDRWPCCYVIGRMYEEQGMPELIQVLLNNEAEVMRTVAAEALGERLKQGNNAAHDALLESAQKETNQRVRDVLARYLGKEMPTP